jgi:hypothetical protein
MLLAFVCTHKFLQVLFDVLKDLQLELWLVQGLSTYKHHWAERHLLWTSSNYVPSKELLCHLRLFALHLTACTTLVRAKQA